MFRLPLLASLAASTVASAAEPILVPDFGAAAPDDFAFTVMIQGQVTDRLLEDGHILLDQRTVAPVVGADAFANCIARPACPAEAMERLPVQVALLVEVGRTGGTLVGRLEIWTASGAVPIARQEVPIAPGNEHLFAHEVSSALTAVLHRVGPASQMDVANAARLVAGQPLLPQTPVPGPRAAADPARPPTPVARPPTPATRRRPRVTDPNATTEELLEGTGVKPRHLVGAEQNFRKSQLDPRDWLYRAMPHAGRVAVEIRAGLAIGDVDRYADTRTELIADSEGEQWYQEGPRSSRRPRGGLYFGYAPATFIDIGVLGGLQYGRRHFTKGTTRVIGDVQNDDVTDPQQGDAVAVYIQPRVRGYLVPVGTVKPFLFTGADFRVFDRYHINQPQGYSFLEPTGGVVPGWIGGGGLMLDPSPIVGFFFEASFTQHFGQRATRYQVGTWSYEQPPVPAESAYTLGLMGGAQFRI